MHYLDRGSAKAVSLLDGPQLTPGTIDVRFLGGKLMLDTIERKEKEGNKEEHFIKIITSLQ